MRRKQRSIAFAVGGRKRVRRKLGKVVVQEQHHGPPLAYEEVLVGEKVFKQGLLPFWEGERSETKDASEG